MVLQIVGDLEMKVYGKHKNGVNDLQGPLDSDWAVGYQNLHQNKEFNSSTADMIFL